MIILPRQLTMICPTGGVFAHATVVAGPGVRLTGPHFCGGFTPWIHAVAFISATTGSNVPSVGAPTVADVKSVVFSLRLTMSLAVAARYQIDPPVAESMRHRCRARCVDTGSVHLTCLPNLFSRAQWGGKARTFMANIASLARTARGSSEKLTPPSKLIGKDWRPIEEHDTASRMSGNSRNSFGAQASRVLWSPVLAIPLPPPRPPHVVRVQVRMCVRTNARALCDACVTYLFCTHARAHGTLAEQVNQRTAHNAHRANQPHRLEGSHMSDQTITPQAEPTPNAPKRTRANANGGKRVTHTTIIAAYAAAHPKDPTAKGLRRVLRANKDADAAYRSHVKNTPWPAHRVAVLRKLFANDAAFVKQLTEEKLRKHAKSA